jgi:hypothetical protein
MRGTIVNVGLAMKKKPTSWSEFAALGGKARAAAMSKAQLSEHARAMLAARKAKRAKKAKQ